MAWELPLAGSVTPLVREPESNAKTQVEICFVVNSE